MVKNNKNSPVKQISHGSVAGSIFINEDKETGNKWYSVNIQKFYNSGTKKKVEWDYTSNFNVNDLPYLEMVTKDLFKWISLNKIPKDDE